MTLKLEMILKEIIEQYNLISLELYGCIYMEIQKGMCGLPQSGILSNKTYKNLEKWVLPTRITPEIRDHHTKFVYFSLKIFP